MSKFKQTTKAIHDLSIIWNYTFKVWSEKQADKYYESIILSCQEIANNPKVGKKYEVITQNLFGLSVNKYIIFYRIGQEGYIEITRILHARMDLKKNELVNND